MKLEKISARFMKLPRLLWKGSTGEAGTRGGDSQEAGVARKGESGRLGPESRCRGLSSRDEPDRRRGPRVCDDPQNDHGEGGLASTFTGERTGDSQTSAEYEHDD